MSSKKVCPVCGETGHDDTPTYCEVCGGQCGCQCNGYWCHVCGEMMPEGHNHQGTHYDEKFCLLAHEDIAPSEVGKCFPSRAAVETYLAQWAGLDVVYSEADVPNVAQ